MKERSTNRADPFVDDVVRERIFESRVLVEWAFFFGIVNAEDCSKEFIGEGKEGGWRGCCYAKARSAVPTRASRELYIPSSPCPEPALSLSIANLDSRDESMKFDESSVYRWSESGIARIEVIRVQDTHCGVRLVNGTWRRSRGRRKVKFKNLHFASF